jgi:hypothetical protein
MKTLITRGLGGHKSHRGRFCYTVTGGDDYLNVARHFNNEV